MSTIGRGYPAPQVKYVVHVHATGIGPRPRGTFADLASARAFAARQLAPWRIDRVQIVERGR